MRVDMPYMYIFDIWIEELYYTNWITMTSKSGKYFHMKYGTLDSCFDLIRSHQQHMLWSLPLEIEPATTESRAETLPLDHRSTSHTSDAKLTSHGKCMTTELDVSWRYVWSLQRSGYALLMRPNKVETAVQCSVCRMEVLAGFSSLGNSINTHTHIYIYIYIWIYISPLE